MADVSGEPVGIAFKAVRQCHADVGRLIADLDGCMANQKLNRLWNQDAVTWGVSRAAYAPYWMAKRLYRLYQNEDAAPDIVEGINIRFFADDDSLDQPRLVVGCAKYEVPNNKTVAKVVQTWDFDDTFGSCCTGQPDDYGKVFTRQRDGSSILKMCVVAAPLYSITKIEDVAAMLDQARTEFQQPNG